MPEMTPLSTSVERTPSKRRPKNPTAEAQQIKSFGMLEAKPKPREVLESTPEESPAANEAEKTVESIRAKLKGKETILQHPEALGDAQTALREFFDTRNRPTEELLKNTIQSLQKALYEYQARLEKVPSLRVGQELKEARSREFESQREQLESILGIMMRTNNAPQARKDAKEAYGKYGEWRNAEQTESLRKRLKKLEDESEKLLEKEYSLQSEIGHVSGKAHLGNSAEEIRSNLKLGFWQKTKQYFGSMVGGTNVDDLITALDQVQKERLALQVQIDQTEHQISSTGETSRSANAKRARAEQSPVTKTVGTEEENKVRGGMKEEETVKPADVTVAKPAKTPETETLKSPEAITKPHVPLAMDFSDLEKPAEYVKPERRKKLEINKLNAQLKLLRQSRQEMMSEVGAGAEARQDTEADNRTLKAIQGYDEEIRKLKSTLEQLTGKPVAEQEPQAAILSGMTGEELEGFEDLTKSTEEMASRKPKVIETKPAKTRRELTAKQREVIFGVDDAGEETLKVLTKNLNLNKYPQIYQHRNDADILKQLTEIAEDDKKQKGYISELKAELDQLEKSESKSSNEARIKEIKNDLIDRAWAWEEELKDRLTELEKSMSPQAETANKKKPRKALTAKQREAIFGAPKEIETQPAEAVAMPRKSEYVPNEDSTPHRKPAPQNPSELAQSGVYDLPKLKRGKVDMGPSVIIESEPLSVEWANKSLGKNSDGEILAAKEWDRIVPLIAEGRLRRKIFVAVEKFLKELNEIKGLSEEYASLTQLITKVREDDKFNDSPEAAMYIFLKALKPKNKADEEAQKIVYKTIWEIDNILEPAPAVESKPKKAGKKVEMEPNYEALRHEVLELVPDGKKAPHINKRQNYSRVLEVYLEAIKEGKEELAKTMAEELDELNKELFIEDEDAIKKLMALSGNEEIEAEEERMAG
ncbi:MAG: hypothetical protein PHS79_03080 [Patescibacteria group bacterium]|nr:hypothetical protein [Patescibacteria group bacterium]